MEVSVDIPKETLLLMYERMLKIRHFENRVKDLFAGGELPGFVHPTWAKRPLPAARVQRLRMETTLRVRTGAMGTSSPKAAR